MCMENARGFILESHPTQIGKRASVHWNLQKETYSIKFSGRPVEYAAQVYMTDCVFHIDARLRAQFEAKPSRRTVHALVKGTVVAYDRTDVGGVGVKCNPFKYSAFVRASDERPVDGADAIMLHADKRIEARGLQVRAKAA